MTSPVDIRTYRLQLKLTPEQFGNEIGVSAAMVHKLEAGDNVAERSRCKISKASEKLLRILLKRKGLC